MKIHCVLRYNCNVCCNLSINEPITDESHERVVSRLPRDEEIPNSRQRECARRDGEAGNRQEMTQMMRYDEDPGKMNVNETPRESQTDQSEQIPRQNEGQDHSRDSERARVNDGKQEDGLIPTVARKQDEDEERMKKEEEEQREWEERRRKKEEERRRKEEEARERERQMLLELQRQEVRGYMFFACQVAFHLSFPSSQAWLSPPGMQFVEMGSHIDFVVNHSYYNFNQE